MSWYQTLLICQRTWEGKCDSFYTLEIAVYGYRIEILGRFPTTQEVDDFDLHETVPMWLPTVPDLEVVSLEMGRKFRSLRDEFHHIYKLTFM